jgi:hypothetical protein
VIEVARTPLGRIALEPKALSRLAREAVESAGGVGVRKLDLSLGDDDVPSVAVTITAPRRAVLPELGALVRQLVVDALQQTLEAPPARVDVTIEGIETEGDD